MPFQDVDEVSSTEYSRASALEAWLRRVFIEDWGLKVIALGIAIILWLAVTGVNKPVTIRTGVQLNFIRPDKLEISNDPPRTIDVLLTGRRSKLDRLSQLDLVATVDLSDQREGERVVRLSSDRVQMELPDGVKIQAFQPSTIPVHLEPLVERQVEVEIKLEGKPAAGFEVYAAHASPERVTVRGPASLVNKLQKAATESISVEGRQQSFSAPHVAVDIPDNKIDLVDSTVDVTVDIGERREERSFTDVPVISSEGRAQPRTAAVTVFSPASIVSQLRAGDIKIALKTNTQGVIEPQLILSGSNSDKITLQRIKPSQFSISR